MYTCTCIYIYVQGAFQVLLYTCVACVCCDWCAVEVCSTRALSVFCSYLGGNLAGMTVTQPV